MGVDAGMDAGVDAGMDAGMRPIEAALRPAGPAWAKAMPFSGPFSGRGGEHGFNRRGHVVSEPKSDAWA